MTKINTHETGTSPNSRNRLIKTLAGVALGTALLYGADKRLEKVDYDPARNLAPPTYMERNAGVNPANIVHNTQDK